MAVSDQQQIRQWLTAHGTPQQVALRSRIVLAAAEGQSDSAIAEQLRINRKTVIIWRRRFTAQYRNIRGVESLWAHHTVINGGVDGVRWYEVRDPNGSPTLFQHGTYRPDSNYHWMGSLAVDGQGDMAAVTACPAALCFPPSVTPGGWSPTTRAFYLRPNNR